MATFAERNITNFRDRLVGGGARPNLFEVNIELPDGVIGQADYRDDVRSCDFRIHSYYNWEGQVTPNPDEQLRNEGPYLSFLLYVHLLEHEESHSQTL